MNITAQRRLSVDEFIDWATTQRGAGRFELVNGEIVAMSPERALHNLTKLAAAVALREAVSRQGLDCTVYTDGMTIIIDENNAREPDAIVECGRPPRREETIVTDPLIIVEVVSPSSGQIDNTDKLVDYFSLPTVQHYLIVHPEKELVTHHARGAPGKIITSILREGNLEFSPPGISISVKALFGSVST
jgi:Uma2 family endonuclease